MTRLSSVVGAACLLAWHCSLLAQTGAVPGALAIELQEVAHARGSLRVGLYDSAASFRKEAQAFAIRQAVPVAGVVRVVFEALPPGEYAVMAYHDEDGNGEMNRRFGMFPTEGYGLSNNPVISGPPAFADSAFRIEPGQQLTLPISLRY